MKKKIIAICLVVCMLAIAIIGGTMAYFTDVEEQDNKFVIGDIDIDLKESNGKDETDNEYAEDDKYDEWLGDQTLFPGTPIAKNVWIENVGDNEAYVRVKIEVPAYLIPVWSATLTDAWTIAATNKNADGSVEYVLTYNTILAAGAETPICLESIKIDPMTNYNDSLKGADIKKVIVTAEAIQTVGFADAAAAYAALDTQLVYDEYKANRLVEPADAAALTSALSNAQAGDLIMLKSGVDYGTQALNGLNDVTIRGAADANAVFTVAADAVLGKVTLTDLDLTVAEASGAIQIENGATIEQMTIKDSSLVGTGSNKAMTLQSGKANITISNTTIDSFKYGIYGFSNTDALAVNGSTFKNISSWAILVNNNGNDNTTVYDLTITGTTFTNCTGGIAKSNHGANTVTFTNNVLTGCKPHDNAEIKWFTLEETPAAAITVSGNTLDGAAWTPGAAQGIGK